jgi:cytochrome c2
MLAGAGAYVLESEQSSRARAMALTGGDPARGPDLIRRFGCAGCHDIPDVRGPGGRVGPPLGDVGARVYLAGRLTNTPENLIRWIATPREVDPKTAMPTTGISPEQARDVAAYLIALR